MHGIYLEDLYVRPAARGTGAGRRLLAALAAHLRRARLRRLDWWMLDWNPARDFYPRSAPPPMDEWVPYRLTGAALHGPRRPAPTRDGSGDPVESANGGMTT